MNGAVAVNGTGIVDALTLSGKSEISWSETEPKSWRAGINLKGDLEAIMDGETIRAKSAGFSEWPFLLEGKQGYTLKINDENDLLSTAFGDYYLMTVGGIKRYFKQQIPIKSTGGVESWDEIFETVSRGESLVLRPEKNGYAWLTEYAHTGELKPGEDRRVYELVKPLLPYWNQDEGRIVILKKIEPLHIAAMPIGKLYFELDGELKLQNPHIHLDNQLYTPKEIAVRGKGTGELYFSFTNPAITLQPKLAIKADYAHIGTGQLDYERNELDGRVMRISSVTSEEIKDCAINAGVAGYEKTQELIELEEKVRRLEGGMGMRNRIGAAGQGEALGLAMSLDSFEPETFLGIVLMITAAFWVPIFYAGRLAREKDRSLENLRIMEAERSAQMRISYSGIQTSRWLGQYPEYLELGKRLTAQ